MALIRGAGRVLPDRARRVEDHVKALVFHWLLVLHAQLFHHPYRRPVLRLGDGYDAGETCALEAVPQDGARGFGRQTAAPMRARKPPADLDITCSRERLQTAESDHAAARC